MCRGKNVAQLTPLLDEENSEAKRHACACTLSECFVVFASCVTLAYLCKGAAVFVASSEVCESPWSY